MKILDVGCGIRGRGDVNVDLFFGEVNKTDFLCGDMYIDPSRAKNPIKADVCRLPFRDKSFDIVLCYHLLEHVDNYVKAIRELTRVARRLVIIRVPHRLHPDARKVRGHKHFFNKKFFTMLLEKMGYCVYEVKNRYNFQLLNPISYLIPCEIEVRIYL